MVAEPAAVPRRAQLPPPFLLAQSPCCATPAMSRSSSGFDDKFDRLPHSDPRPARLPVAFVHVPVGLLGRPPPSPQEAAYWMAPESLPFDASAEPVADESPVTGEPSSAPSASWVSEAST